MNVDSPLSETHDDRIFVRGHDLADLIGRLSFTEMFLLDLHGSLPAPSHVRMIDAILVAIMEHGTTPSTLATRLILDGAPESMQGAVAGGLLAVGSRFLGTIEEVAALLQEIVASTADGDLHTSTEAAVANRLERGMRVPGLGHNLHQEYDPRVMVLLALADREDIAGDHVEALHAVETAVTETLGKLLIANAAGAVGAILSDLGYPADQIRGFALVARCAGLVAHVVDEMRTPQARAVWERAHSQS